MVALSREGMHAPTIARVLQCRIAILSSCHPLQSAVHLGKQRSLPRCAYTQRSKRSGFHVCIYLIVGRSVVSVRCINGCSVATLRWAYTETVGKPLQHRKVVTNAVTVVRQRSGNLFWRVLYIVLSCQL